MQSYVVVEMFLKGKMPKVRGVYRDRKEAEKVKNVYKFCYISNQNIIQNQSESEESDVYVVMELLGFNIPKVVGVFKDRELANEMAKSCEYNAQVIEEQLN